jgi:hypothetical protein
MRRFFFIVVMVLPLVVSAGELPRLKVSADGRWLVTEKGGPFFWLGDTGWLLLTKLTREEAGRYFEDRRKKGFNVIQIMLLHGLKDADVYGHAALTDGDIARPLAAQGGYWDHVDYIVNLAKDKGLYVALVPVWGSVVKSGKVSRSGARAYAGFLAARYKAQRNIIWMNGGDIRGSDSAAVWNTIGATLRAGDPDHLITYHPRGRASSAYWFHQQSWLDLNSVQSGHRSYAQDTSAGDRHFGEDNWKYIAEDYNRRPVKPVLDAEPSYEQIPYGLHDTLLPRWTDRDVRRYAYWSVFAGACGYTYGDNSVMQMLQPSDKGSAYGAKDPWTKAIDDPGAGQMIYLKKLMLSKPYFERVPDASLIAVQGTRYDHLAATRGTDYAFIYTCTGGLMKINMGKIGGDTVHASWYSPRDGGRTNGGNIFNKGVHAFAPPAGGEDWVLILESVTKNVYLFTSFREPATEGLCYLISEDGYHWKDLGGPWMKPAIGDKQLMRDPSMAQGADGIWRLVWTSGWNGDKGFGYAYSKDLVHWSQQQFIPVMQQEPEAVNVWAPEIFYQKDSDQFLIVWATTIPGRFPRGQEDEKNNQRLYCTTTRDLIKFSPTRLFFDPGYSVIDATVVQKGAGDYVLVFKDNTRPQRNIRVAYGRRAGGPYHGGPPAFTPPYTEGPAVAKVGRDWLIYYDMYRDHAYGAMRTADFKTFTDVTDQVSVPEGHKHGTIVMVDRETVKRLMDSGSIKDIVHYSGSTLSNVDYHHGQLKPVVGVHNIQVFRANREHPELAENFGWTYNHAPMLAYWNNRFYLEYLSDKTGESVPPGQTLLLTSADGSNWGKPAVLFPAYKVPDGTTKAGHPGVAKDLMAVMHQRMGFYVSKGHRLLALGFYGICLDPHDDPNDGLGIGRVVREIRADGSFGPVYFIHYNPAWNEQNTAYPLYTSSGDKDLIADCNELMATPLMMMQWVEETDRKDPLIPLHKDYKAFNFYHLPDNRVVGLWKNALTGISRDEGRTWSPVKRAPHFVNSNAKIWGQRTSDGKYAAVYNPSEFRWPLALSTSADGLDYKDLLLVQGEISQARYGGNYKSYGPQYVRGIEEGNGVPPDGNLWVTYSMNKEDIWVASVPAPVTAKVDADVDEWLGADAAFKQWNIYSPLWAPVSVDSTRGLVLKDGDPYDFAMAERVFPVAGYMQAVFSLTAGQSDHGQLQVEFQDERNMPAVRLSFEPDGTLIAKAGARVKKVMQYEAGKKYLVKVTLNTGTRMYTVNVNGQDMMTQLFFAPVESFGHIVFRTGEARHFPTAETAPEAVEDLPHAGDKVPEAWWVIDHLKTSKL